MTFPKSDVDLSGMPLSSLRAVVLDTETTGLDVAKDRVVEIGATRIAEGRVDADGGFTQLVNPGVPIPELSREVHGLTDADVAGAPAFPEAMGRFVAEMGPVVVLGYSLGFDMGVLKAEHDRHGMIWRAPRTVDVAHAVRVINPQLPNHSLDVVAQWLGVAIEGRHRAMADARATAEVYLRLLPLLRERGIENLAQLERRVREHAHRLGEEEGMGWVGPASVDDEAVYAGIARLDSFPYRHRVGDIMYKPKYVDVRSTLSEVMHLMDELKTSSIFVADGKRPVGIVTERDVLRTIKDRGADALRGDLSFAVRDSLFSVAEDEFVYRALLLMDRERVRHLAVLDAAGEIVGVVTTRSMLRVRAEDAIMLGERIEAAESVDELGRVWGELVPVVHTLRVEEVDARDIAGVISRELRALTRRACEIAEREMLDEGLGPPPADYAMMVLGSGGRGESLLAMDQDNAIVHEAGDDPDRTAEWMAELGGRVSGMLGRAGLALCKGGVMASSAEWRMDLESWLRKVDSWVARAGPEDFLSSDIFFDGVWVHGRRELADGLLAKARAKVGASANFIRYLSLNASRFDSAVGVFGKVRTRGGRVDLKLRGVLPVFSAARAVALRHGVAERSTAGRLRKCVELGHAEGRVADGLLEAQRVMMGLILSQQLRDIKDGIAMGTGVDVGALSSRDKDSLEWALSKVPDISDLLGTPV